MAFSPLTRLLLASTMIYIFVSTLKLGRAYDYDDPNSGAAAGAVEPETNPGTNSGAAAGAVEPETNPGTVFVKALECLNDKYIYSSCDEAHRLTQNGELNVPPEYTDQYCDGPCLTETKLVLKCIDETLKHFVFYNRATVKEVLETIHTGCSYGPKRGDFNVAEHMQADEANASSMSDSVFFYSSALMITSCLVFFNMRR